MGSSQQQSIVHDGVVTRVEGAMVEVRILQASACAGCAAARLCQSSEVKEKSVTALCRGGILPSVGDHVRVEGTVGQGLKATLLAYVVPLALVVAVLALGMRLLQSEGMAALLSIAALIPYYFVLFLMRSRLQGSLTFEVKETLI